MPQVVTLTIFLSQFANNALDLNNVRHAKLDIFYINGMNNLVMPQPLLLHKWNTIKLIQAFVSDAQVVALANLTQAIIMAIIKVLT